MYAVSTECDLITSSYCSISIAKNKARELNLDEFEDLDILPVATPEKIKYFEVKPTAISIRLPENLFHTFPSLTQVISKNTGIRSVQQNLFVNASNLKDLDLESNKLTVLEATTFSHASELNLLNLANNQIAEIQDNTFQGLNKLSKLSLSGNQIKQLKKSTFLGLESLQKLDLDSNKIETVEDGALNLPQLRELTLGHNKLKLLADGLFSRTPLLKVADFRNNELLNIGEAFANCQSLIWLNLENNNQLTDLKLSKFVNLPALRAVSLKNSGFRIVEDEPKPDLVVVSRLERLGLPNNHLSNPNIFRHLSIFPQLKYLYLQNNDFTHFNDVKELRSYLPKLERINLKNNTLLRERFKVTGVNVQYE